VVLLGCFIVVTAIAMFSAGGTIDEMVWIGITADPLDAETAAALGIPTNMGGVIVREVDGIAQRAGVQHGDVLLGINGKPVPDMKAFSKIVGETNIAGRGAQLDIVRQGVRLPIRIEPLVALQPDIAAGGNPRRLNAPPAVQGLPTMKALPIPTVPAPAVVDRHWLGIDAETFPIGEGRAFGIPAGVGGVLIDGVVIGSRGERAGLKANDVIVSVNGQKVDTTVTLWNLMASLEGANWVELGLYRGGRLTSVSLPTVDVALVGGFPGRGIGLGVRQGRVPFCAPGQFAGAPLPMSATPVAAFPGRMGGMGLGLAGCLVCPNCGTRVNHQRAVSRLSVPCPSCGTLMTRVR
jgi:hypothetical protein